MNLIRVEQRLKDHADQKSLAMSFRVTFSTTPCVNYQCYSRGSLSFWSPDSGWLADYPPWLGLGPVTADGWGRLRGPWTGPVWGSRGLEGVWGAGVYAELQGERQPAGVPPLPPSTTLTCTRGGGTNGSGGLYDHREDKKRERVRDSMCFPQARQQLRDNDLCFSQNSGISKCYI